MNRFKLIAGPCAIEDQDTGFHIAERVKSICEELDIVPSDSVWLATSTREEYQKFRRSGDTARLCLAGIYNEQETLT